MAEIECESWETGKPFLGIPSKFVVVNEDGENIGTLAELLPTLLYKGENLFGLADYAIARQNLDVLSVDGVNTAISTAITNAATPDATEAVKGKAKIATDAQTSAGADDASIVTPKKFNDNLKNLFGSTSTQVTGSRLNNTFYQNPSYTKWMIVEISTIINAGGSFKFFRNGVAVRDISSVSASWGDGGCFLIPPRGSYKTEGTHTINYWVETI